VDQYQQWLSHYDLPVCSAVMPDGAVCGEPLLKVERPSDYTPGESDCCPAHRPQYARSHTAG